MQWAFNDWWGTRMTKILRLWGVTPMLPDALYRRFAPFVNLFEGGAFPSQHVLSMNIEPAPFIGEDIRLISDPRRYLANLIGMQHLNMRMETWAAWSAQFGFQYRYPLLDRNLLEFVLGMPLRLFFEDGNSRYLAPPSYRTLPRS